MAGIKLKNIRKSYQVEDRNVPVLNGIDLDIPQGQITVILGQSGCGKTTLLRLTGGLEAADSGTLNLFRCQLITVWRAWFAGYLCTEARLSVRSTLGNRG